MSKSAPRSSHGSHPRASLPELTLGAFGHKSKFSAEHMAIDMSKSRIHSVPNKGNELVYVRYGGGGLSTISGGNIQMIHPPTSVVREQYWACAKWPRAQKYLVLAVGLLAGALIGLTIGYILNMPKDEILGVIIRQNPN